jgi:hypothetical protein
MQSKKLTSLFLALVLLISNLGLAFNVHYCGDQIASFSSVFATMQTPENNTSSNATCCCVSNKEIEISCCKDKVVDLKKETKEVVIKTISCQIDVPFTLVKSYQIDFVKAEPAVFNSKVSIYFCRPNAPPLFKLYQQYLFYA